jgi:hypothetical protein
MSHATLAHTAGCLCDRCLYASWRGRPKADALDESIPFVLTEAAAGELAARRLIRAALVELQAIEASDSRDALLGRIDAARRLLGGLT